MLYICIEQKTKLIKQNKMKNQNINQNSKLIEIKSVDSVIDTDSGNIYPLNQDGTVDFTFGISLENEEVSSDWYDGLSDLELKKVLYIQKFLQLRNLEKHLWKVIKSKNVTKGAKKAALKKLAEVQRNQGII